MKIAVISDIHGILEALQAALTTLRQGRFSSYNKLRDDGTRKDVKRWFFQKTCL